MGAFTARLRLSPEVARSFATRAPPSRGPPPKPTKPKSANVKRFVPEDARKFVAPGGKLLTSAENESFFLRHRIEPDTGTMAKMTVKELRGTTTAAFSPRHVINPYHLKYFDPRGHPLASAMRDMYRERNESQALWVTTTVVAGVSPVVRATAARKLKKGLSEALRALGYDDAGVGQGRQIRGTLWLTVTNPLGIITMSQALLGAGLAKALHEQHSRPMTMER